MLRTRIILVASAAILVALLFNLPKVVVDNDPETMGAAEVDTEPAAEMHSGEVDAEVLDQAEKLKDDLKLAENNQKSITFADSLAKLYLSINKYDSAAKFFEIIADIKPQVAIWQQTGDAYYDAYGFAMDRVKQQELGKKAREYFQKVLDVEPENSDAKNKLAMTLLSTSNPMEGIMMLREILENDPENEQAMFNLGVLSMQSGQYDKAVERFSGLVKQYPNNTQAQFFLGVSYVEIGDKTKAKEQFNLVKSLDKDPAVQATVESYLEELE